MFLKLITGGLDVSCSRDFISLGEIVGSGFGMIFDML
tara:strand:+ start:22338 stop:22448 length:111 start_codon:yes stop_codon:yes gene_type:complete